MADTARIHETIEQYWATFSAGDADAWTALFAPDGTVEDPVGSPLRRGHEEIRQFFTESQSMCDSIELRGIHAEVVGHEACFSMEIRPVIGGVTHTMRAIDHMTFDDDARIVTQRAFFQPETMRPAD